MQSPICHHNTFLLLVTLVGACDDPSMPLAQDSAPAEDESGDGSGTATEPPPEPLDDDATPRSAGKAMTWTKNSHNASLGTDNVGCANCNAYTGDTMCSAFLPVLCIKQDGSVKPSGLATDFYNGWTGGHIATTHAIQGSTLTSLQVANQFCIDNFGPGWRMAEFHDGKGGWNWHAYGDVRQDSRFWVHINDQPSNCWNP
jgi:hypothetical protein